LNEQAKQVQGGGDGAAGGGAGDMAALMGDMDPKMLEEMAQLGSQFDEVMKLMAEMSPEELENQMKDAMEMMQSGDMMQNMMQHQDEILKTLEETGQVDADELAKFKADPEYFEQKIKESFEQMGNLFSDPDALKMATDSMAGLQDMYKNPGKMAEMMDELLKDFDDDDKIEEVRQLMLESPELGALGDGDDMKDILNDPKKFRETVQEGRGLLNKGAGVGEL
jgi:dsDNA-specific endonuclease/ATPase MutS2